MMKKNNLFRFILIFILCLLAGCHPGKQEEITPYNALKKLKPSNFPEFTDHLKLEGISDSIDKSITYFKRVPLDRIFQYGPDGYTAAHLILSLETLRDYLISEPSPGEVDRFIRSRYLVYEAAGNEDEQVLFTGYYEPTYPGSFTKTEAYKYPIYSKPDDLLEIDLAAFSEHYKGHKRLKARVNPKNNRVVPYYSRAQINSIDDFSTKAEPVGFLKNRVDRFFLEIQGSGRLKMEDGEEIQVHYAASNGNAYRSIGRYLINKNEILKENMSMQAIREWLDQNPDRMDEVLHHNTSFVFFQIETEGPKGSLGVKVSPMRSIATDAKLFPKGAACFMLTRLPVDTETKPFKDQPLPDWQPASLFVMNQDTGGAIKGPARADLFCGNGEYAEFTAGHKNIYGRLFFLVLKP